jgi:polyhydroxybutyrate depolymerase
MRLASLLAFALLAAACSSGGVSTTSTSSSSTSGSGGAGGMGGGPPIGGDRPVDVKVPGSYQQGTPAPLLILLHGYSVDGDVEELYLHLGPTADKYGFLYAHPSGTIDSQGNYFWNATDACCNYDGSSVDDSSYLSSVITEIEARYTVDPKRVYVMGHSNGGFMAYRLACDHADQIATIVSLAGAMWEDTSKCQPKQPVTVLQIHGTADPEVIYDGSPGSGTPGNGPYPGAETSVKDWAMLDGCALTPDTSAAPLDLDEQLAGAETTVETYAQGCQPGGGAVLWSIQGGTHIPNFGDTFHEDLFQFLMAHPRP